MKVVDYEYYFILKLPAIVLKYIFFLTRFKKRYKVTDEISPSRSLFFVCVVCGKSVN